MALFGGNESDFKEKHYVLATLLWILLLMNFPREFVVYLQPGLDPEFFWLPQTPAYMTVQTNVSHFPPPDLESLRSKAVLFPEAMQDETGQLDRNFREAGPTARLFTQSLCLFLYHPLRKVTRYSDCKPGTALSALFRLKAFQASCLEIFSLAAPRI